MTKTLFSELDKRRLDAGLDWHDQYPGVDVILVNMGLTPDVVNDVTSMGFITYEGDNFDHADLNLFHGVLTTDHDQLARKQPDDVVVYVQNPEAGYDLSNAWASPGFFAGIGSDLTVDNLVFPITSIAKRVEFSRLLETEVLGKYDTILDSRLMGGPLWAWLEFFSLYKSFLDSGIIEHSSETTRNLLLNVFAAIFPEKFKFFNVTLKGTPQ